MRFPARVVPAASVSDRGVGTMLAVGVMVVVMFFGYAAILVAGYLAAAHQARLVADLAAVSGASAVHAGEDACAQAVETARANGGRIAGCARVGDQIDFVVTVRAAVVVGVSLRGLPRSVEAVAHAGPGSD